MEEGPENYFSTKIIRNGHNKLSLVPRSHHICSEFEKKHQDAPLEDKRGEYLAKGDQNIKFPLKL